MVVSKFVWHFRRLMGKPVMVWPPVPKVKIEWFGDSTTAGTFLAEGKENFVWRNEIQHLQWFMEERFGAWSVSVVNNGIGGTQAKNLLEGTGGYGIPWAERMRTCSADIVGINFGLNDAFFFEAPVDGECTVTPDEFYRIICTLISVAVQFEKAVVVQTPNPTKWQPSPWSPIYEFVSSIERAAEDAGAYLVDQFHWLQTIPDWIALLSEDGVHPGPAMYALKASRTSSVISPVVSKIILSKSERDVAMVLA